MSNQIEEIRAEIERRISENTFGAKLELIDILAWLDTLPGETVSADAQEAADKYIGHPYEVAEGVEVSMCRDAYAAGMLAERERLASCPTIKGWVMRDKYGSLKLYEKRPHKIGKHLCTCTNYLFIKDTLFPDLREDEPREVEIIIKTK